VSVPDPDQELTTTIDELATGELVPAQRRRLLRQLARHAPRRELWRPRAALRWAVDSVTAIAPHIPVRDLPTLHAHHNGLTGEALAERLVRNAARATAGVGAVSGGLVAVKWAVPPTLLAAPVLLSVETIAVVAIEMKMIGELHAAYGAPIAGTGTQRAAALLRSWAEQRGINPTLPGGGVTVALSTAARKELSDRLVRRFGRNLPTLAPLLAGAAVASYLNQRATRSLGRSLALDLGFIRPARPAGGPPTALPGS
jgi:hypothetical protein